MSWARRSALADYSFIGNFEQDLKPAGGSVWPLRWKESLLFQQDKRLALSGTPYGTEVP